MNNFKNEIICNEMMQSFNFTYDDNEFDTNLPMISQTRLKKVQIVKNASFEYKSVLNDLERLEEHQFEEIIKIVMTNSKSLEFFIHSDKNELKAHFTLDFNNKYPFEAPKMCYLGPRYDFITNIQLTFDFKKFGQGEWTIRESITTIIQEVINKVFTKTSVCEKLEWTKDEDVVISFLKELNCFMNTSYFEEYTSKHKAGLGTGYGKSSDSSQAFQIEEQEGKKKEMFKQSLQICTKDKDLSAMIYSLDVANLLYNYLEKASYLFVNNYKEFLSPWVTFIKDEQLSKMFQQKTNFGEFNNQFETGPNIIVDEDQTEQFVKTHYNCKEAESSSLHNNKLLRRIMIEIMDIDHLSRTDSNIRFAWSPEKFLFLKFIVGSENEPYYGGFFEFHAYFPKNYPASPPQVHLVTTASNTVRFNPNLYDNGKVCLSLLGTWSGEQWNPAINCMLHVIQAISVMILTDQPVQNEPAYSSDNYFDSDEKEQTPELLMVKRYKFSIKYYTLKYGLLNQLQDESSIFHPVYHHLFQEKRTKILESAQKFLDASKCPDFDNIANAKTFQENKELIFDNYPARYTTIMEKIQQI